MCLHRNSVELSVSMDGCELHPTCRGPAFGSNSTNYISTVSNIMSNGARDVGTAAALKPTVSP